MTWTVGFKRLLLRIIIIIIIIIIFIIIIIIIITYYTANIEMFNSVKTLKYTTNWYA